MNSSLPKISVVLASHGKSPFIPILKSISCQLLLCGRDFEIIVITSSLEDDPSKSLDAENSLNGEARRIKIYQYVSDLTEDQAFSLGFSQTCGDPVVLARANEDFSALNIRILLAHFDQFKADIVLGSKVKEESPSPKEKVINTSFKLLAKFLFGLEIPQSQIPLRVYKREILEAVLPKLQVKNSAFDLELLLLARDLGYEKIVEAPIAAGEGESLETEFGNFLTLIRDTSEIFYQKVILGSYKRIGSLYQS